MAYVLAALTGLLTAVSFPMLEWWPIIFVAYTPMLIALEGAPLWRRFRIGWTGGTVTLLLMQYWISHTMVHLSGFSWWLAIVVLLVYAGLFGLSHAIFGIVYGWLRTYGGRTRWLYITPFAWALLERTFPSLFPYYCGNALYRAPVLMQSAEVFGIGGVSALVFFTNCAITHLVEERAKRRTSDFFLPLAVCSLWLLVAVFGAIRMSDVWENPTKAETTIALIQPNVTVSEKRDRTWNSRQSAWTRTVQMTAQAAKGRPDLIVWPEGGFPFQFLDSASSKSPLPRTHPYLVYSDRLRLFAMDLKTDFIAGSLTRQNSETRNSALFFPEHSTGVEVYDKQRLLPFGEQIPLANSFPSLRDAVQGMTHHEAGTKDVTWEVDTLRIAVGICYEAIFPEMTRKQMNSASADILLNLTNDVWFGDTAAPYLHLMVQQARAIEMRSWLVRSTNSGISAFIDPTGRIQAQSHQDTQETLIKNLRVPTLDASIYRRFGDMGLYVCCLISLVWFAWPEYRQRKKIRDAGNNRHSLVSMKGAGEGAGGDDVA